MELSISSQPQPAPTQNFPLMGFVPNIRTGHIFKHLSPEDLVALSRTSQQLRSEVSSTFLAASRILIGRERHLQYPKPPELSLLSAQLSATIGDLEYSRHNFDEATGRLESLMIFERVEKLANYGDLVEALVPGSNLSLLILNAKCQISLNDREEANKTLDLILKSFKKIQEVEGKPLNYMMNLIDLASIQFDLDRKEGSLATSAIARAHLDIEMDGLTEVPALMVEAFEELPVEGFERLAEINFQELLLQGATDGSHLHLSLALIQLGRVYARHGQMEDMRTLFLQQESLTLSTESRIRVLLERAKVHALVGEMDQVRAILAQIKELLSVPSKPLAELAVEAARFHIEIGDRDGAKELLSQVADSLRLHEEIDAEAPNQRRSIQRIIHEEQLAIKDFEGAARNDFSQNEEDRLWNLLQMQVAKAKLQMSTLG